MKPALAGNNEYPRYFEWKQNRLSIRPFSVWRYMSDFYSRDSSVGFKLMYSHLRNYPETVPFIAYKRLKIIHLIRTNYLDIILSEKIAELTGTSHTTNAAEDNKQALYLDPVIALNRVKTLDANTRRIRKLTSSLVTNQSIEIHYEDILKAPDTTMETVKDFLGIDTSVKQIQSNLKKRQTKTKQEIIGNYDELVSFFSQTKFEYLFND